MELPPPPNPRAVLRKFSEYPLAMNLARHGVEKVFADLHRMKADAHAALTWYEIFQHRHATRPRPEQAAPQIPREPAATPRPSAGHDEAINAAAAREQAAYEQAQRERAEATKRAADESARLAAMEEPPF
jgi:flagellar biosynthesis/type III secretory pathway protein FliH